MNHTSRSASTTSLGLTVCCLYYQRCSKYLHNLMAPNACYWRVLLYTPCQHQRLYNDRWLVHIRWRCSLHYVNQTSWYNLSWDKDFNKRPQLTWVFVIFVRLGLTTLLFESIEQNCIKRYILFITTLHIYYNKKLLLQILENVSKPSKNRDNKKYSKLKKKWMLIMN